MITQETEGLVSPLLTRIRLRQVASRIHAGSSVLDLACGAGFLSRFLPAGCRYYGVDRVPEPHRNVFTGFLSADLMEPDAPARVRGWLPEQPDYIACVAFIEHITEPAMFLRAYSTLLRKPGHIIGTTPHPNGRTLHDSLSKVRITSPHGAAEHEKFFGRDEIQRIASDSGGRLATFSTFLFGLNQLFTIEYR